MSFLPPWCLSQTLISCSSLFPLASLPPCPLPFFPPIRCPILTGACSTLTTPLETVATRQMLSTGRRAATTRGLMATDCCRGNKEHSPGNRRLYLFIYRNTYNPEDWVHLISEIHLNLNQRIVFNIHILQFTSEDCVYLFIRSDRISMNRRNPGDACLRTTLQNLHISFNSG